MHGGHTIDLIQRQVLIGPTRHVEYNGLNAPLLVGETRPAE